MCGSNDVCLAALLCGTGSVRRGKESVPPDQSRHAEQCSEPAELPVHLGQLQGDLGDQQGRLHTSIP